MTVLQTGYNPQITLKLGNITWRYCQLSKALSLWFWQCEILNGKANSTEKTEMWLFMELLTSRAVWVSWAEFELYCCNIVAVKACPTWNAHIGMWIWLIFSHRAWDGSSWTFGTKVSLENRRQISYFIMHQILNVFREFKRWSNPVL